MIHLDLSQDKLKFHRRFPLVIASNMLGELPSKNLKRAALQIGGSVAERGALVLMEPALRKTARNLLGVRDILIREKWHVIAPCPGSYLCPAYKNKKDWCHHRVNWSPPEYIQAVDRITGFHKETLNFTYFVFKKVPPGTFKPDNPDSIRRFLVVSDLIELKGKKEVHLCGFSDGQDNRGEKWTAVLENKKVSDLNSGFLKLQRYSMISVSGAIIHGGKILIQENTRIHD